jgi:hypothetical protein
MKIETAAGAMTMRRSHGLQNRITATKESATQAAATALKRLLYITSGR